MECRSVRRQGRSGSRKVRADIWVKMLVVESLDVSNVSATATSTISNSQLDHGPSLLCLYRRILQRLDSSRAQDLPSYPLGLFPSSDRVGLGILVSLLTFGL